MFIAVALLATTFLLVTLSKQNKTTNPAAIPVIKVSSPGLKIKAADNKKNSILKRFISCVELKRSSITVQDTIL